LDKQELRRQRQTTTGKNQVRLPNIYSAAGKLILPIDFNLQINYQRMDGPGHLT
jgi:hypothetical protein